MSCWPVNLSHMLDPIREAFGIVEIRRPERLQAARQTGFVWTAREGVVCLAMNRRYFDLARANGAVAAIIIPPALAPREDARDQTVIVCEKADQLYHHLHQQQSREEGPDCFDIDPEAHVDPSAVLRGRVSIGAGARIGPRVVITGPAAIGREVRIDSGAIIGCEGLYAKQILGVRHHITHLGGVAVGDGAFIHAGAVIVRSAVLGEATRIGARAHVGILSNIGHDVQVGEAATISSNVVIAGRASVGARAWIGASATVSNMVEIGRDAEVRLGAVAIQDVPAGADVSGNFALPHARNMKRFLKDSRNGT